MKDSIVVVYDDVTASGVFETFRRTRGLHVLAARNATEVCDIICCEGAAVVVVELGLRHTKGFEVLRRLRGRFEARTLPTQPRVVVMAHWAEPAVERLAFRLGADAFLPWPAPIGRLLATIERFVAVAPEPALAGGVS